MKAKRTIADERTPAEKSAGREVLIAYAEGLKARREAEANAIAPVDFDRALAEMMAQFRSGVQPMTAEAEREFIRSTQIFPRLKTFGWGERFLREYAGDWGCPQQAQRFARCRELFRGVGAIVALVGPRGVGKTSIGFHLALARAWEDWQSQRDRAEGRRTDTLCRATPYRKLTDLLAQFKALYADFGTMDPERLAAARDHFCTTESLAVIDEIHECEELKSRPRLLTDLLDRRYLAKKDTLLITNQTAEEFEATIGDSIYSRLTEHGAILRCEWPSWRGRKLEA